MAMSMCFFVEIVLAYLKDTKHLRATLLGIYRPDYSCVPLPLKLVKGICQSHALNPFDQEWNDGLKTL